MGGIVGIDVGGTFTDLFYSKDGITGHTVLKVPSTPDDPSRGLVDALTAAGILASEIDLIVHGTTIATNAVIERRGARCALVTTKGFRDVLELGRRDRPHMYGLTGVQNPLIPRDLRWELDERVDHRGQVIRAPDDELGCKHTIKEVLLSAHRSGARRALGVVSLAVVTGGDTTPSATARDEHRAHCRKVRRQ